MTSKSRREFYGFLRVLLRVVFANPKRRCNFLVWPQTCLFCSREIYGTSSNGALLGHQVTPKQAQGAVNGRFIRWIVEFWPVFGPYWANNLLLCCAPLTKQKVNPFSRISDTRFLYFALICIRDIFQVMTDSRKLTDSEKFLTQGFYILYWYRWMTCFNQCNDWD